MKFHEKLGFQNIEVWVIGFVIYLFFRYNDGDYQIAKWFFEVMAFSLLITLGSSITWISRYFCNWVIVPNQKAKGSILRQPIEVPVIIDGKTIIFVIHALGGSLEPYPTSGKMGVLIYPKRLNTCVNGNHISGANVRETAYHRLPKELRIELSKNPADYNLDKVFYGIHGIDYKWTDTEIQFANENEALNSLNSKYDEIIDSSDEAELKRKDKFDELGKSKSGFFGFGKKKEIEIE